MIDDVEKDDRSVMVLIARVNQVGDAPVAVKRTAAVSLPMSLS